MLAMLLERSLDTYDFIVDILMRKENYMTLKYCKVREVKSPCRAHATDAGIDFFVPTDLTEADMAPKFETTGDKVEVETKDGKIAAFILKPNESVLIPSGIHVNIPDGYALIYMNKSGIASKKNLHIGACLVD